ncbi:M67 family metallopeptidase [Verrucomicrobiota bacterium]
MELKINKKTYDQIVKAAKKSMPLEACGLLAGKDTIVNKSYEMTNADASPTHFTMIPEEQFAAVKDIRINGLKMLAIWHSHPATPPRISNEDLRLAYTPDVAYVILSLADPDRPEIRGYVVNNGNNAQEINITINNT